jgi:predicted membrane channel-forming protein YqfA (hemolysin III family)
MRGAIIFLIAFVIFFVVSLTYPGMPPGRQIYDALGVEDVTEPVAGISTTTLVIGVFNGVIYGVIIWFISYVLGKAGILKRKKKEKKEKK